MRNHIFVTAAASFTLLLGSTGLVAQQGVDPTQLPPEAQELMTELQEIQMELQPVQEEALQDPELQAEQADLGERIQVTMSELDPETPEQMARLQELVTEAQAAQAEQDAEAVGEIMNEAQEIQVRLQDTQTQALEHPEIAPRVRQFRERLHAKMVEMDPEVEPLIERAQELDERLAEIIGGAA